MCVIWKRCNGTSKTQPFAVPFADVRWLPARGSIDRSLEDKPLGGRKKIVITATIAVDRRGKKGRERERENEREMEKQKKKIGMVRRVINQAHLLVSLKFSPYPEDSTRSFIGTNFAPKHLGVIILTAEYRIFGT